MWGEQHVKKENSVKLGIGGRGAWLQQEPSALLGVVAGVKFSPARCI